MFLIGLAIVCLTICEIVEEICDCLKNKKDNELE